MVATPDSRWLIAGHGDSTVRMWDTSGRYGESDSKVLRGHADHVLSFAVSNDGRLLVTGSADTTARVWSLRQPDSESLALKGHAGPVTAVAMSPSGRRVMTLDSKSARVWDFRTKQSSTAAPLVFPDARYRVEITDRWAITIRHRADSNDFAVLTWDLNAEDPTSSATILGTHEPRTGSARVTHVRSISTTPDGRWLATGGYDGTAQVWDLDAKVPASTRMIFSHPDAVTGVQLTPDGRWLATSCDDRSARVWDLHSDNLSVPRHHLPGHEHFAWTVAITADGRWIATGGGGRDKTARVWDLSAKDPMSSVRVLSGHERGAPRQTAFGGVFGNLTLSLIQGLE